MEKRNRSRIFHLALRDALRSQKERAPKLPKSKEGEENKISNLLSNVENEAIIGTCQSISKEDIHSRRHVIQEKLSNPVANSPAFSYSSSSITSKETNCVSPTTTNYFASSIYNFPVPRNSSLDLLDSGLKLPSFEDSDASEYALPIFPQNNNVCENEMDFGHFTNLKSDCNSNSRPYFPKSSKDVSIVDDLIKGSNFDNISVGPTRLFVSLEQNNNLNKKTLKSSDSKHDLLDHFGDLFTEKNKIEPCLSDNSKHEKIINACHPSDISNSETKHDLQQSENCQLSEHFKNFLSETNVNVNNEKTNSSINLFLPCIDSDKGVLGFKQNDHFNSHCPENLGKTNLNNPQDTPLSNNNFLERHFDYFTTKNDFDTNNLYRQTSISNLDTSNSQFAPLPSTDGHSFSSSFSTVPALKPRNDNLTLETNVKDLISFNESCSSDEDLKSKSLTQLEVSRDIVPFQLICNSPKFIQKHSLSLDSGISLMSGDSLINLSLDMNACSKELNVLHDLEIFQTCDVQCRKGSDFTVLNTDSDNILNISEQECDINSLSEHERLRIENLIDDFLWS